ncbi:MAG: beta-galactosidase [Verrucomicrobia bacterium]|nr:beta-galactosidase [Verrucomicrobiota bacterium]
MAATTRRTFLKQTSSAAVLASAATPGSTSEPSPAAVPWYRRTLRWGQTNITEIDPPRYDIAWWRQHWKRTRTQGVIINAGGIFSYYPTRITFHRPARQLGERDLFGELCRAAHDEGLVVFARMDSNRAHEDLYRAHPDWFACDAAGRPHKAGDLFVTCVNGPYYEQHIPAILREIAERYRPEGFTDNSWSGLGRGTICHCENCRPRFRERSGRDLPARKNWDDVAYQEWIRWNYDRRLELWDLNNRVTRSAGGPDCIWSGMISGSVGASAASFRDVREISRRAEILMLDHQARRDDSGFQHNGDAAKRLHGVLGWEKLIPESMAMYQAGRPAFRLASKPAAEARLWMLDGIAGGLQPWWHHVGAYHEDRRMYRTAEPIYRWHEAHAAYLVNREPVATVGVVWSQANHDFFGRDDAESLVEAPWRGITQALLRARIPYLPIHADDLARQAAGLSALILPNVGAMSDSQLAEVRRFVTNGGGLLATGETSRYGERGEPRSDFGLADLLGAHAGKMPRAGDTTHTYLRLVPERRAAVDGPRAGNEPPALQPRHEILRGFEETDLLPFGGTLGSLRVEPSAQVLATFVPAFPLYPPETAWMRTPTTDLPGLVVHQPPGGGRVAYLPADLDRRFAQDNLPDHGDLLANLVRWVARHRLPLSVEGAGLVDCHLYRQGERRILHLVNLTSAGTWRAPVDELIRIGPLRVRLQRSDRSQPPRIRLLVARKDLAVQAAGGWCEFEVPEILDHEVVVIE